MSEYHDFLESKRLIVPNVGIDVAADDLHPALFDWQRDVTRWALKKGRAAIFAGTGMGRR